MLRKSRMWIYLESFVYYALNLKLFFVCRWASKTLINRFWRWFTLIFHWLTRRTFGLCSMMMMAKFSFTLVPKFFDRLRRRKMSSHLLCMLTYSPLDKLMAPQIGHRYLIEWPIRGRLSRRTTWLCCKQGVTAESLWKETNCIRLDSNFIRTFSYYLQRSTSQSLNFPLDWDQR